ncbi:hypothetical protein EVA_22739, partial [gut metagenome]
MRYIVEYKNIIIKYMLSFLLASGLSLIYLATRGFNELI